MRNIKAGAILLASCLWALQSNALNILLTNDDGYQHPWIRTVYKSLSEAGHEVTLVAPYVNQSGMASALTLGDLRVDNPKSGIYAVHGTPAAAVMVGVAGILRDKRPDLVVSGINYGANVGVFSSFSGTVGATVAALNVVGEPIPAIAISGNPLSGDLMNPDSDPGSEGNLAHAREIASFVARLVQRLEETQAERGHLLPRGIALNVNYPTVPSSKIKGVDVYRHGRDMEGSFWYENDGDGIWRMSFSGEQGEVDPAVDMTAWDTRSLAEGYITVVPIDGDYTAEGWRNLFPASLLHGIEAQ